MKESEKLQLLNVTLCAMTSVQVRAAVKALEYSMRGIHFADVLIITDKKPLFLPKGIHYRHTSRLSGIDDFNYKCVYELGDYIETDFVLLIHSDGLRGAPGDVAEGIPGLRLYRLPLARFRRRGDTTTYRGHSRQPLPVGNSVGIRSKRLLDYPKKANIPWTPEKGWYNEDGFLCCRIRHLLEAEGMRIAPPGGGQIFRP